MSVAKRTRRVNFMASSHVLASLMGKTVAMARSAIRAAQPAR
jgi:hypothetical protein